MHLCKWAVNKRSVSQPIPYGSDVACPGGQANPMICVSPKVHNQDESACICEPGYFLDAAHSCQACTNGHFCADGVVQTPCPRHTYQDGSRPAESRTACERCTSTGDEYGGSIQICPQGTQAAWCDRTPGSGLPESQGRSLQENCVKCNRCNTDYYQSQVAGSTKCYI
jgi:hypothetical protein